MKKLTKILAVFMSAAMVALLAVPAFAGISLAPNMTGWGDDPDDVVHVKKVDPSNVVKDGVIGEGEYERLDVDLGDETSPLIIVAFAATSYDNPFAMLPTMEYYFSWDEVHGFNFAVRNKPVVVQQLLDTAEGDCPQDDFARNTAYVINFQTDDGDTCLYYALAKRTDNDRYLEGYYTTTKWSQLGATHNYDPEPGTDYVISYGNDGYVTVEWSIPLNNFFVGGGGVGSTLKGTISATAGTAVTPFGGHDKEDSYAVSLGDYGYGVDKKLMNNHVEYRLTDEPVPVATDTETGTGTDAETDAEPETGTNTGTNTGTSTETGTGSDTGTNTGTNSESEPGTNTETGKGENTETGTGTQTESGTGTGTGAGASTETGSGSGAGTGSNTNNGSVGGTGSDTAASSGSASAPRTGDPMVIISAVAAVTAAGAFIVGKKRR